jgi:ABC-type branched-subunit amino acid transport system substrate-binding protein
MKKARWCSVVLVLVLVAGACGRDDDETTPVTMAPTTAAPGATTTVDPCQKEPLRATEVGVTETTITIEVMADVGSPLAPGLFQGNLDAVEAFAEHVNKTGGIACRKLAVKTWDSKLNPEETKNGLIDACRNAVALVGGNALFNPDVKPMTDCVDKAGQPTGLPNIAALANDITEQCAPTSFIIQAVAETCPVTPGSPRPIKAFVGPTKFYVEQNPGGLSGIYMVPGDLPTTVQSATFQIAAIAQMGVTWLGTPKVSGRDEQPAYTPRIQTLKARGGNFVYNGSNDVAMIRMRKEAKAQGLDTVKVWACSLACYTRNMLSQGGADVEGTWVWMQFLPFEEADTNPELKAYVDSVGANKVDSFGAQAWQAGVAFRQVVQDIGAKDGPNGITRAKILDGLRNLKNFNANGWMGEKDLRGFSQCFLMMQIKGGKFERVFPAERGKLHCSANNLVTVTLDPVAEAAKIQ